MHPIRPTTEPTGIEGDPILLGPAHECRDLGWDTVASGDFRLRDAVVGNRSSVRVVGDPDDPSIRSPYSDISTQEDPS